MTATITTLQASLKTALDAIPSGSRPAPYAVRIQEGSVSSLIPVGSDGDVVIGFEAKTRLGRTGAKLLEQYLVPITIMRRSPTGVQSDYDTSNALGEYLQDVLVDYHTSTTRVEQILTPHPFDQAPALTAGTWIDRFVLDIDLLRADPAAGTATAGSSKFLTDVRNAVWNAFDHWEEWDDDTWARKFQSDADRDELALHDPCWQDLPAIAVEWGPVNPRFLVHIAQDWPATINVVCWFPPFAMQLAEQRAYEIVRAVYQSGPSGPDFSHSYVRTAAGRPPEKDSPITIEIVELGRSQQLKAIKVTCSLVITAAIRPQTD